MMERILPDDASSDGIHFDRPRGTEWLNGVFQRHINMLRSDMLEIAQFTFDPSPIPPFFVTGLYLAVWERELSREIAHGAGGPDNWVPHR